MRRVKSDTQLKLDYLGAVADWFLDLGDDCVRGGNLEGGIRYNQVAARALIKQNRDLSSARLEANLRLFAGQLPRPERPRCSAGGAGHPEVCLHVLNEAMGFGGLIAMAMRWIKHDQGRVHSVAILSQTTSLPSALVQAVSRSGGKIHAAGAKDTSLRKADWLRRLAYDVANIVVLHVDVDDVIAGVAFGIRGGPPVLLVNHAAHIFWTGASIADVVVNCRGSRLEAYWTINHRGIPRCATIPIPLSEPEPSTSETAVATIGKKAAKATAGIPEDAILILTVGAAYKYTPFHGLDFLAACERILTEIPEGFLMAAGVVEDSRWRDASIRCRSRIKALGSVSQAQLAILHEAADLYVEGFPFGSTTALLEAGLRGIPVVLGPAESPPPYCTDGVALDDLLRRPKDIAEYQSQVVQLCRSVGDRDSLGQKTRIAVRAHHTGSGWLHYLQTAIARLPREHDVYPTIMPKRTPDEICWYWSEFLSTWSAGYESILEDSVLYALSNGLRPKVTPTLKDACQRSTLVRNARTIPLPLLAFLCNTLLPLLPISWGRTIFRVTAFLFRRDLLSRLRKQAARLLCGRKDMRAPHEQYRTQLDGRAFPRLASNDADGRPDGKVKNVLAENVLQTIEK